MPLYLGLVAQPVTEKNDLCLRVFVALIVSMSGKT